MKTLLVQSKVSVITLIVAVSITLPNTSFAGKTTPSSNANECSGNLRDISITIPGHLHFCDGNGTGMCITCDPPKDVACVTFHIWVPDTFRLYCGDVCEDSEIIINGETKPINYICVTEDENGVTTVIYRIP
jgi:hypothetical protein